jgi:hypothetical protein
MSPRHFLAPMFIAALLLGGTARASEPRSCPRTCGDGPAAAGDGPHGSLLIGIGPTGLVQVEVKSADKKAGGDYQVCFPLGQLCPILGKILGVPVGAFAQYFADQEKEACGEECSSSPGSGCGPADGGVSLESSEFQSGEGMPVSREDIPNHFMSGLANVPPSAAKDLGIPIKDDSFADVAKQVHELLTASHQALQAGDYERAQSLAQKALDLDPRCVAAHPLVSKGNLIGQLQRHCLRSFTCVPPAPDEAGCEGSAAKEEEVRPEEEQQSRRPARPAIDPKIVGELEQTLNNAAEPLPARLVVLLGEENAAQGQEDLSTAWPAAPGAVEVPSLLAEPVDEKPAEAADPDAADADKPQPDMNAVLREVIEAVRGGVCLEIDHATEDGLVAQCEVQVGGVEVKLIWSETGCCRCAVVRLLPEACTDAGAVQRFLDREVIEWIQALNEVDEASPKPRHEKRDVPELEEETESDI